MAVGCASFLDLLLGRAHSSGLALAKHFAQIDPRLRFGGRVVGAAARRCSGAARRPPYAIAPAAPSLEGCGARAERDAICNAQRERVTALQR
eukprot:4478449-Pyramimonas_sp.AAC.1